MEATACPAAVVRTTQAVVEAVKRLPDDAVAIPHSRNPRSQELWQQIDREAGHPVLTAGDVSTLHFVLPDSALSGARLQLALDLVRNWHGHASAAKGVMLTVALTMTRHQHGWTIHESRRMTRARTLETCGEELAKPRVRSTRPRERRDGSRRHSTRGGTDDSDGGEPPGGPGRTCAAESCHNEVTGRADKLTCSATCKKRLQRAGHQEDGAVLVERDAENRIATLSRRIVAPDPLDGVDPDLLWCLYENEGLAVAA